MNLDRFPQKNTTAKFGNAHLPNQRSVDDKISAKPTFIENQVNKFHGNASPK